MANDPKYLTPVVTRTTDPVRMRAPPRPLQRWLCPAAARPAAPAVRSVAPVVWCRHADIDHLAMLRVSGRTSHGSRDQGTSARPLGRTGTRGSPLLWPGRAMPSQHYAAGNERTPSTDALISTAGSTPLLHAAASLLLRPCSGHSSELHGREQTDTAASPAAVLFGFCGPRPGFRHYLA